MKPHQLIFPHHLIFVVAAALAANGCHHATPVEETIGVVPAGSFVRAWKTELHNGKDPVRRVFARGNFVFAYTEGSTSYVLDRAGGQMKFIHEVATTGGVLRPPVVLADKIVYPTATTLELYSATVNKHLRTTALPNSTHGPAMGVGQLLYVSLDYPLSGRVGAVDLTRLYNIMNWELYTRAGVRAAPAVYEKAVYFGTEDGTVYAVDNNRNPFWGALPGNVFKTYGRIIGDLKVDDFGVYVASGDQKLYCLDRNTGQVKWQYFGGIPLDTTPSITATSVYQFVEGKGIVAINKTAGNYNREPKWTAANAKQFLAEDDKNAYLRRGDNTVVALDKMSGEERFSTHTPFDFYTTNERDGVIYAVTRSGTVIAIKPVLAPGQVGTLVMDMTAGSFPLASAAR